MAEEVPDLFQRVDTPIRRRLQLKGQATISIVLSQIAAPRKKGEPSPPDRFMLRMLLIQPRPGGRPKKTVISSREVESEEEMWMCLRQLADDRLLTLGQLQPPEIE